MFIALQLRIMSKNPYITFLTFPFSISFLERSQFHAKALIIILTDSPRADLPVFTSQYPLPDAEHRDLDPSSLFNASHNPYPAAVYHSFLDDNEWDILKYFLWPVPI